MKRIFALFISIILLLHVFLIVAFAEDDITIEDGCGEPSPTFSLDSLEEYNEYWEEHKMPENFVTYEQLSFLGKYLWFFYPIEGVSFGDDSYGYHLRETGEEKTRQIAVIVYNDPTVLTYLNEEHKVTPTGYDLREDNWNGIYCHDDNLGYHYLYNGKLRNIYLKIDDVVLAIQSDDGGWDKFDPNENHVICRLLNQKTASLAYQEFVRLFKGDQTPLVPDLNLKPAEKDNQTLAIAVSTGVGAVAIGTAAAVIVKKKKKAKK